MITNNIAKIAAKTAFLAMAIQAAVPTAVFAVPSDITEYSVINEKNPDAESTDDDISVESAVTAAKWGNSQRPSSTVTVEDENTEIENEDEDIIDWSDDGVREAALAAYLNSNWTPLQYALLQFDDDSVPKTAASDISKEVRAYKDVIKDAITTDAEPTLVNAEEYTNLMLAILQVMSGGKPNEDDPYNIKELLYNESDQDKEVTQEISIKTVYEILVRGIRLHNEENSRNLADENETASERDAAKWYASVYSADSQLQTAIEGIVTGTNYPSSTQKYSAAAAEEWITLHEDRYRNRVTQPDPSFADEVLKYYKTTSPKTGFSGAAWDGEGVPRYYQGDYGYVSYGSGSIASCGCGPTSFAMAATYLTGIVITPEDAVAWCGNAYYVSGAGTSWSYFGGAAKYFGVGEVTQLGTSAADLEKVKAELSAGRPVISSQSAGLFTRGGHFICLSGITDDGKILVNDPNKANAVGRGYNDRQFDLSSEINANACAYWIFGDGISVDNTVDTDAVPTSVLEENEEVGISPVSKQVPARTLSESILSAKSTFSSGWDADEEDIPEYTESADKNTSIVEDSSNIQEYGSNTNYSEQSQSNPSKNEKLDQDRNTLSKLMIFAVLIPAACFVTICILLRRKKKEKK